MDGVYSSTVAVTLPNGLSGPFFVIVAVDRANAVFELDNVNNLDLRALSIAIIPPDVRVSEISGDAVAEAGGPLTVGWTVRNDGPGDTIAGIWVDRVIATVNDVVGDGDDVGLACVRMWVCLIPVDRMRTRLRLRFLSISADRIESLYRPIFSTTCSSLPGRTIMIRRRYR